MYWLHLVWPAQIPWDHQCAKGCRKTEVVDVWVGQWGSEQRGEVQVLDKWCEQTYQWYVELGWEEQKGIVCYLQSGQRTHTWTRTVTQKVDKQQFSSWGRGMLVQVAGDLWAHVLNYLHEVRTGLAELGVWNRSTIQSQNKNVPLQWGEWIEGQGLGFIQLDLNCPQPLVIAGDKERPRTGSDQ